MGLIKEFKAFAMRGNVIDLAVGVIIGSAFGKIVDSIVNDLMMPLLSAIIGKPDFSSLYVVLRGEIVPGTPLAEARKVVGSSVFAYGNFVTITINFLLLALVIFLLIKGINTLKRKQDAPTSVSPEPSAEEKLLAEIRDLLKHK
ncbi:MAG: large-conductance mechanosensitive channel [Bacteroidetes bacterium]|nr:large-conductance mechanosensitive channel [Bacteroidota bacterium]